MTDQADTPTPEETTPAPTPAPEAAAAPAPVKPGKQYIWGTGRRKASVARVRICPGSGEFKVNGKDANEFFRVLRDQQAIIRPLMATDAKKQFDVFVNVGGGGTTGQAGAIVLGLARALRKADTAFEQALRDGNFLTRDARKVERKKYGQRGARRRFQFSKR